MFFTKGASWASLVTDGTKIAVYGARGRVFYTSMAAAIAAIERKGYRLKAGR